MEFNVQNPMSGSNTPMDAGGKKASPLVLIIVAIAVAGLIAGTYVYMQGWVDDYYPGFMTDWQQPFCVLLTKSEGVSTLHETIYEDRFHYTDDLVRMGADMRVGSECGDGSCRFVGTQARHYASVRGPTRLHGRRIMVPDLRAGMAQVIGALAAEGTSFITGIEHIDRGYEKIDERLRSLGAKIERVTT